MSGRILRAMMKKEVGTFLRERGQLFGILAGMLAMLFGMAVPSYQAGQALQKKLHPPAKVQANSAAPAAESGSDAAPATPAAAAAPSSGSREQLAKLSGMSPQQIQKLIRWIVIGFIAFLSIFIAIMFGTTMSLAAFVGEREANTVEVLLAAPMSHPQLYILKCLSVIIPAAIATTLITAMAVGVLLAFVVGAMPAWVWEDVMWGLVCGLPLPLLFVMLTNSMCIAASIRAETVKGAGQMVGVAMMAVMFPLILGPVLLAPRIQQVKDFFTALGQWWLNAAFVPQYSALLLLVLLGSGALLLVGYLRFDRERMLT